MTEAMNKGLQRLTRFAMMTGALALIPAPVSATSLEDAVVQSLNTNPEVQIRANNRKAIDEELRQARGLYLPQVDVEMGIGREWTSNLTTRTLGAGAAEHTAEEYRGLLSQRLFDGFEADSEVARQKSRIASAARRVYETSEFLALDAINSYLQVILQKNLLALAEENVAYHRDILGRIKQRQAGGAGSSADVSQTQARLERAISTLHERRNDVADAYALYLRVVGTTASGLSQPSFSEALLPGSIDDAIAVAQKGNPTIKILQSDVKVADAEIDLAGADYWPKVNFEVDAGYFDDRNGVDSFEDRHAVMVRARWNLFRGGIKPAGVNEAKHRKSEAQSRVANATIIAREQMEQSWNAHEASVGRQTALAGAVAANQQTLGAYVQQFQVGQRTLLDVLDAQNELFATRSQLATVSTNRVLSGYRILAVGGQLLTSLDIVAPGSADEDSESFGEDVFGTWIE